MYNDILLPFDGSDGAIDLLHHSSAIAQWADATIHVLFVADTTRDSIVTIEGQVVDALEEQGEDVVEEAAEILKELGVDHETDVVQGNPAPSIANYAAQYGHDLIIMPTHGRTGVSRYLLGSVTEKVVRLSAIPVLTSRIRFDERLAFPYENILIPTDGSRGATLAARHGLSLAVALNATVHALSVVDDTSFGFDVRSTASERSGEKAANNAVDDLLSEAESHGVTNTVSHVESGSPFEEILSCLESNDIDAVVMGTTGRRGTDRILFGSVAEKTVRSAPVPVITVGEGVQ
ncbi:universal stress protein [Haladaptatus pallidirubidus]|uniref:UspA domain-containing protein n=1 Tax=Haladaptatus pallidirubidus TaxID=1008152 RepID=A0AAV3UNW5_9EURY|nr:universal stress protein [Haladaptatus pallidirubidus]